MYNLYLSPADNTKIYAIKEGIVKRLIEDQQTLELGAVLLDRFWVWQPGTEIPIAREEIFNAIPEGASIHLDQA